MSTTKLVRIPPHSPRHGYVLRRLVVLEPKLMRFESARGWYEVPEAIARSLEHRLQDPANPLSQKAFLIANDAEEARRIDEKLALLFRTDEEERVGTADKPVKVAERPGKRLDTEDEKRATKGLSSVRKKKGTKKKGTASSRDD